MRAYLAVSMLLACSKAAAPLPFIDNDEARARAEATERHLPIFVEVWAPW